jgi:hypothetical protein
MRWEDRLVDLFDDLEQQAEGLALAERDTEVAELSRAEYARVDLDSRLHASAGHRVALEVVGLGRLGGVVRRLGADWLLVEDGQAEWLVRAAAVAQATGLSPRAVHPSQRPVTARLGLGSALRGVAEERAAVRLHRLDGGTVTGVVRRVGADFVELAGEDGRGEVVVVALGALAAVRRR